MSNSCYCIVLRKASRKLSALYDEALAPFGINISQFSTIRNINRSAPISLTDLADKLELDRSTVGRNMKVLERMGIVTSSTGEDQREAVLVLTDAGKTLLKLSTPVWYSVQEKIETKLGTEKSRQLAELLDSI